MYEKYLLSTDIIRFFLPSTRFSTLTLISLDEIHTLILPSLPDIDAPKQTSPVIALCGTAAKLGEVYWQAMTSGVCHRLGNKDGAGFCAQILETTPGCGIAMTA